MNKTEALKALGGTATAAAEAVGVSPSAVSQWPEQLPPRIADRVLAALARKHLPADLMSQLAGSVGSQPPASVPQALR